jgi:uncharacterized LabA/DUF88 family protein
MYNRAMFIPKTDRIQRLALVYPKSIQQIEQLLVGSVSVYIDYANIRPWAEKLGWHIDPKRLMQFLESFNNIGSVKFYTGTLVGDSVSEAFALDITNLGYDLKTKPVKIMDISINASSIDMQSTALLKQFIRPSLLRMYDLATIEHLNKKFVELNNAGTYSIQDRKCNFDVELGRDMLLDYERNGIDTYVLWSGDSDFADPIAQLMKDGKNVRLFATSRRVATEINALKDHGLFVFDIQKIKDFICWKKEMTPGIV